MKRKITALVSGALAACMLFSACGTVPNVEPTGGDWRTQRGYTSDFNLFGTDDVTFSRFTPTEEDPDSYGYAAYETTAGSRIGALIPPADKGYRFEDEASDPLLNKDLDGDGVYEFGLCYNDGRVVWFGWDSALAEAGDPFTSNPLVCLGFGNTDGILPDTDDERGLSQNTVPLSDTQSVRASLETENPDMGIVVHVYDADSNELLGVLNHSAFMGASVEQLDMDENGDLRLGSISLGDDGYRVLGIGLKDGIVLWFAYAPDEELDNRFQLLGVGDSNGPSVDPPEIVPSTSLTDTIEVKAVFGTAPDLLTIDILDVADDTCYGTIQFNDPAITANDVVCLNGVDPKIITLDLDYDGYNEVGVPMLNGTVEWFALDEHGFLSIGAGTEDGIVLEDTMLDTLFEVLGEKAEGRSAIRSGTVKINGVPCEEYAVGSDRGSHYNVEGYYAVSPDGTVYVMDIPNSSDYVVYTP